MNETFLGFNTNGNESDKDLLKISLTFVSRDRSEPKDWRPTDPDSRLKHF